MNKKSLNFGESMEEVTFRILAKFVFSFKIIFVVTFSIKENFRNILPIKFKSKKKRYQQRYSV